MHAFAKKMPLRDVVEVFDAVAVDQITSSNIRKLLLFIRDKPYFSNKSRVKWRSKECLVQHYRKHVLSSEENNKVLPVECVYWKYLLKNIECASYERYAIDSFYKMKNVIVHTDGAEVWLSGFHGNVFIIGRYSDKVFGISSCYYVVDGEKQGRYKGLCFRENWC